MIRHDDGMTVKWCETERSIVFFAVCNFCVDRAVVGSFARCGLSIYFYSASGAHKNKITRRVHASNTFRKSHQFQRPASRRRVFFFFCFILQFEFAIGFPCMASVVRIQSAATRFSNAARTRNRFEIVCFRGN